MGKTVNTQHVKIMYDNPKNTHTHTSIQSLAGRATGYNKKSHGVIVYCDVTKVKEHNDWIKSGYSKKTIPSHAKYIVRNKLKEKNYYSELV